MINKFVVAILKAFEKFTNDDYYIKQIDHNHERVHYGDYFEFHDYITDLDNEANKVYLFKTGAKEVHATLAAAAIGEVKADIYEDATITADGTEATPINMNRTSTKTAETGIFKDPTVSDNGNLIISRYLLGSTTFISRVKTDIKQGLERIYKPNTNYLIIFTAQEDNCQILLDGEFYEKEV